MTEEELFLWVPVMSDPPLANISQMHDGTFNIVDVLDMHALLQWKANQIEEANTKRQMK